MKTGIKKLFALILTAAYLFTLAQVTVFADITNETTIGGTRVGAQNYTSDDGSITWDHANATLTLNNAHLTDWTGFYFEKPAGSEWYTRPEGLLKIILKGDNTINSPTHGIVCNGDMEIIAEPGATLTVNASLDSYRESTRDPEKYDEEEHKYDATACIGGYNVSIKGGTYNLKTMGGCITANGNLNIEDADITAQSDNATVIFADKDINIKGNSTLNVTAPNKAHNYHFESDGDGQIQVDDPYDPAGIYATGGSLNITGSGNRIEVNTLGIAITGCSGVTIADGAEITANSVNSHAVRVISGDLTIKGKGTTLELDSYFAALCVSTNGMPETAGDIIISDGASVTGTVDADSAIYTCYGNITITGADTVVDVNAYFCGLQSGNGNYYDPNNKYDVTVSNGASLTATSAADTTIYNLTGDVNIESGASLTIPTSDVCGIFTVCGSVNISGNGTAADIKSNKFSAIQGNAGINIKEGASLTANSTGGCGMYSPVDVTIDGKGTTLNVNSYYSVIQTVDSGNLSVPGNITISGGANLTGTTNADTAIFTYYGDITVKGADTVLNLNAANSALYINSEGAVTITDGASITATAANAYGIFTKTGDIEISGGADVKIPSANYYAIGSDSGNVTITGTGTTAELNSVNYYAIFTDGNINISDGANVTGKTDKSTAVWTRAGNVTVKGIGTKVDIDAQLNGIKAVDVEISDGADVTVNSNRGNAVCTDKGSIVLDGRGTSVKCASQNSYAIYNSEGTVTLNAGHIILETSEGPAAVMVRKVSETAEGIPAPAIILGNDCTLKGLKVAATDWDVQYDDRYYYDSFILPEDTVLDARGLLTDSYEPALSAEITRSHISGDVDGDGIVDARDLVTLKKYLFNFFGNLSFGLADVNNDGAVDIRDLIALKKLAAG